MLNRCMQAGGHRWTGVNPRWPHVVTECQHANPKKSRSWWLPHREFQAPIEPANAKAYDIIRGARANPEAITEHYLSSLTRSKFFPFAPLSRSRLSLLQSRIFALLLFGPPFLHHRLLALSFVSLSLGSFVNSPFALPISLTILHARLRAHGLPQTT